MTERAYNAVNNAIVEAIPAMRPYLFVRDAGDGLFDYSTRKVDDERGRVLTRVVSSTCQVSKEVLGFQPKIFRVFDTFAQKCENEIYTSHDDALVSILAYYTNPAVVFMTSNRDGRTVGSASIVYKYIADLRSEGLKHPRGYGLKNLPVFLHDPRMPLCT